MDSQAGTGQARVTPCVTPMALEGGPMKTTLEIPDELFRRTKAMAAMRGESLKDFVTAAIRAHVLSQAAQEPSHAGWRSVFGQARPEEVAEIDGFVAEAPDSA